MEWFANACEETRARTTTNLFFETKRCDKSRSCLVERVREHIVFSWTIGSY